jgi:diguanylate cyclase (GGDEF)-like protein
MFMPDTLTHLEEINSLGAFANEGPDRRGMDGLTGCFNTGAFNFDFDKMLIDSEVRNEDMTLVMIDIDNFKLVNDNYGHETGDEVLKEIAKILFGIGAEHKTYRYSGDQFALLFPSCEKETVFLIMEEIRKKIAAASHCSRTSSTISAGVATYSEDGTNDVEIIRKAEGALYRAKTSGRNKVALAKEEKLVTKTAHYTVEQLKRLQELSEKKYISEAALMREALDELLKKYNT